MPHRSLPIDYDYSVLCNELRILIRSGLTGSATLHHSPLLGLAIVRAEAGDHASAQRKAAAFMRIFERVVHLRLTGKDRDTARVLFALGAYAGYPMQDRYRAAAKLYHPHWTWENYRKEPLTRLLITLINILERETELAYQPSHNTQKTIGLIGQQWQTDEYVGHYSFPDVAGTRIIAAQERVLRSMTDGVDVWSYRIRWKLKGSLLPPSVELQGPGTISLTDAWSDAETGIGFAVVRVKLPRPVSMHNTVKVSVLLALPCNYDELIRPGRNDWFGLLPAVNTIQKLSVGLRFPRASRPKKLWKHEELYDGIAHAGSPTADTLLTLDETGYMEYMWSPAEIGYSHGISMEW